MIFVAIRFVRAKVAYSGSPIPEYYKDRVERLGELERLSRIGKIDLYYGDESHVCSQGYVPYGWQFAEEQVCILSEKAYKINCFGMINRQSQCYWKATQENIDAEFVLEYLDKFSFQINKDTFIVLDNARLHKAKIIKERIPYWQSRGLFLFYLPPYSPHLNIAETLWRKLKKEWLNPEEYINMDTLFYATNRCLSNVGRDLKINFCNFNEN